MVINYFLGHGKAIDKIQETFFIKIEEALQQWLVMTH